LSGPDHCFGSIATEAVCGDGRAMSGMPESDTISAVRARIVATTDIAH
jgi:hypothetical protein